MFELVIGPFLARALLGTGDLRSLDSDAIVRAVLDGVTSPPVPKTIPDMLARNRARDK